MEEGNKRKTKEDTTIPEEIREREFGLTSEIANKVLTLSGWILVLLIRTF